MQFGDLLTLLAVLAGVFSTWNYYQATRLPKVNGKSNGRGKEILPIPEIRYARYGFYAMTAFVSAASMYLYYLILTHQFQFDYVARYSSRNLELGYLISSFWAGQEGSFLTWVLLIVWLGVAMVRTGKSLEAEAMITVNAVTLAFLLILLKASPFTLLPQVPEDGSGLNPLLQNPWMVVHPPLLFLGYAAVTFPFALGVAAMWRRQYQAYIEQALPWALFSSVTLGAGIMVGAYWAYMVLGWGGYWGWDPVENSSLIPWLTTMAFFHGLVIQKRRGVLPKINLFLATASFGLVIYATFLTRSGVLADFSVHSFEDLGINLYLILFILGGLAVGWGLLYQRRREISGPPINLSGFNREAVIWASMIIFLVSTVLILIGTSSPILTGLIGDPAQVDTSFYNIVHFPIGIGMALLLGFAPFLRWKNEEFNELLKRLIPSLILTAVSIVAFLLFGMTRLSTLLFAGSASFALWSNFVAAIRGARIHQRHIWAPVTHIGLALVLVGIIVSATFERNSRVLLPKGILQEVMEFQMTYRGKAPAPNGKDLVFIEVISDKGNFTAKPRFYYSTYNGALMREPDVQEHLLYDTYITPLQLNTPADQQQENSLVIHKGEQKEFQGLSVRFVDFDMSEHSETQTIRVGAKLEITQGDQSYQVTPTILYQAGKKADQPAKFKLADNEITVSLDALNASQKAIKLGFSGFPETEAAAALEEILVEVSVKPFMTVLWIGMIILTVGTIMAFRNRLPGLNHTDVVTKEKEHVNTESMLDVPK